MATSEMKEKDRATAAGNAKRIFAEIWTRGFRDMRADKQTDRQTR